MISRSLVNRRGSNSSQASSRTSVSNSNSSRSSNSSNNNSSSHRLKSRSSSNGNSNNKRSKKDSAEAAIWRAYYRIGISIACGVLALACLLSYNERNSATHINESLIQFFTHPVHTFATVLAYLFPQLSPEAEKHRQQLRSKSNSTAFMEQESETQRRERQARLAEFESQRERLVPGQNGLLDTEATSFAALDAQAHQLPLSVPHPSFIRPDYNSLDEEHVYSSRDATLLRHCTPAARYVLHTVNPGEGFSLRVDAMLRLATMLSFLDGHSILVLPPFPYMSHWVSQQNAANRWGMKWSEFFDLSEFRAQRSSQRQQVAAAAAATASDASTDHAKDRRVTVMDYEEYQERQRDAQRQVASQDGAQSSSSQQQTTVQYAVQLCRRHISSESLADLHANKTHFMLFDSISEAEAHNGTCRHEWFSQSRQEATAPGGYNSYEFGTLTARQHQVALVLGSPREVAESLSRSAPQLLRHCSLLIDQAQLPHWAQTQQTSKWKQHYLSLLPFSASLQRLTHDYLIANLGGKPFSYAAAQLRRGDFLEAHGLKLPTLRSASHQIKLVMQKSALDKVFVASNMNASEWHEFESYFTRGEMLRYQESDVVAATAAKQQSNKKSSSTATPPMQLSDGHFALLDANLCIHSRVFIATPESFYSSLIVQRRELVRQKEGRTDLVNLQFIGLKRDEDEH